MIEIIERKSDVKWNQRNYVCMTSVFQLVLGVPRPFSSRVNGIFPWMSNEHACVHLFENGQVNLLKAH